jgi:hypothetical protein
MGGGQLHLGVILNAFAGAGSSSKEFKGEPVSVTASVPGVLTALFWLCFAIVAF